MSIIFFLIEMIEIEPMASMSIIDTLIQYTYLFDINHMDTNNHAQKYPCDLLQE